MSLIKFNQRVSNSLLQDEKIVAHAKVTPKGSIDGAILSAAGFSAGGVALGMTMSKMGDDKKLRGEQERKEAQVNLGNHGQVIVGLSNKRLLVWSKNLIGSPKKLIAAINRNDINDITMIETKILTSKMVALHIQLNNNTAFDLQIAKIHKKKGVQLIGEFKTLKSI